MNNLQQNISSIRNVLISEEDPTEQSIILLIERLKPLLENDRWYEISGERHFETFCFRELGCNVEDLKSICRGNVYVQSLISEALKINHQGWPNHDKPIVGFNSRPSGNSREQALRRLRKDRPDLYAKVIEGSISSNQAMIEAGLRKKQITIQKDVNSTAQTLVKNFTEEEIEQIFIRIKEIQSELK